MTWQQELVIDIIMVMDIFTEFVTTKPSSSPQKIQNIREIAGPYIKGMFIFDCLACLPGIITFE
jgi:hypothetical protein